MAPGAAPPKPRSHSTLPLHAPTPRQQQARQSGLMRQNHQRWTHKAAPYRVARSPRRRRPPASFGQERQGKAAIVLHSLAPSVPAFVTAFRQQQPPSEPSGAVDASNRTRSLWRCVPVLTMICPELRANKSRRKSLRRAHSPARWRHPRRPAPAGTRPASGRTGHPGGPRTARAAPAHWSQRSSRRRRRRHRALPAASE